MSPKGLKSIPRDSLHRSSSGQSPCPDLADFGAMSRHDVGVSQISYCYAVTAYGSNRTAFRSHKQIFRTLPVIFPSLVANLVWPSTYGGRPVGCTARLE